MRAKSPCPRHHGLCAFTGDTTVEPTRCPWCHTTEKAIKRCHAPCCRGSIWHHVQVHEREDAQAAERNARQAQTAAGRKAA